MFRLFVDHWEGCVIFVALPRSFLDFLSSLGNSFWIEIALFLVLAGRDFVDTCCPPEDVDLGISDLTSCICSKLRIVRAWVFK